MFSLEVQVIVIQSAAIYHNIDLSVDFISLFMERISLPVADISQCFINVLLLTVFMFLNWETPKKKISLSEIFSSGTRSIYCRSLDIITLFLSISHLTLLDISQCPFCYSIKRFAFKLWWKTGFCFYLSSSLSSAKKFFLRSTIFPVLVKDRPWIQDCFQTLSMYVDNNKIVLTFISISLFLDDISSTCTIE